MRDLHCPALSCTGPFDGVADSVAFAGFLVRSKPLPYADATKRVSQRAGRWRDATAPGTPEKAAVQGAAS